MDCDRNSVMTLPVNQCPSSWSNPSNIKPLTPTVQNNSNAGEGKQENGRILSYAAVVKGQNRTNQPSEHVKSAKLAERPSEPIHTPILAVRYPEVAGNDGTFALSANVSLQEKREECMFQKHSPVMRGPCEIANLTCFSQFHALYDQQNTPVRNEKQIEQQQQQQQQQQSGTGAPLPKNSLSEYVDLVQVLSSEFRNAILALPEYQRLHQVMDPNQARQLCNIVIATMFDSNHYHCATTVMMARILQQTGLGNRPPVPPPPGFSAPTVAMMPPIAGGAGPTFPSRPIPQDCQNQPPPATAGRYARFPPGFFHPRFAPPTTPIPPQE